MTVQALDHLSLWPAIQRQETGLVLKNLNDDIYDLFQDIGLDRIFTIEERRGSKSG